jgi:predicted transcriptional regulator
MTEESLEEDLLKAVRRAPNRRPDELADVLGLPRTNFGRSLGHRLRRSLERLRDEGLVEERSGRYRLAERGRVFLAERALSDGSPH